MRSKKRPGNAIADHTPRMAGPSCSLCFDPNFCYQCFVFLEQTVKIDRLFIELDSGYAMKFESRDAKTAKGRNRCPGTLSVINTTGTPE
jgi:hypothetical protein